MQSFPSLPPTTFLAHGNTLSSGIGQLCFRGEAAHRRLACLPPPPYRQGQVIPCARHRPSCWLVPYFSRPCSSSLGLGRGRAPRLPRVQRRRKQPTTVVGVPPGYPLDVDVVAPLVITTIGPDPIPVTGTDGKGPRGLRAFGAQLRPATRDDHEGRHARRRARRRGSRIHRTAGNRGADHPDPQPVARPRHRDPRGTHRGSDPRRRVRTVAQRSPPTSRTDWPSNSARRRRSTSHPSARSTRTPSRRSVARSAPARRCPS